MNIAQLHEMAQSAGVCGHQHITTEDHLIRAIQRACNHQGCFQTDKRLVCEETQCPWRHDCKKLVAAWKR